MKPLDIINTNNPEDELNEIIGRIHVNGPINLKDLEVLAYLKEFHYGVFEAYENKLMYLFGLFYKAKLPKDVVSFAYSIYMDAIKEEVSNSYTPVQASIRNGILRNKYFSFSAPTSAGKSFLIRELVKDEIGDILIVVPSRALIAEYMLKIFDIVKKRKDILILQYIDNVNLKKTKRRIFIVTPERARDIFKYQDIFNVGLFLYDEAQISEEKGRRSVEFDALVRRIDTKFPNAKKVFAHPFIENPEAQFLKHQISSRASHHVYKQNVVGKMYLYFDKEKDVFERFSPFIEGGHLKNNKVRTEIDIPKKIISDGGTILIYVSKASIYDRSIIKNFEKYIKLCNVITNPEAVAIIKEIEELIGEIAKESFLVKLMKKGVVIHHGSIPLNIRFLIEKFTSQGFAKICFATSTLTQGINMPFDLVWIDNFSFQGSTEDKILGLKNLIGRAGRSSNKFDYFDYGYVVVANIKRFSFMLNESSRISEISKLDEEIDDDSRDLSEFIDAIKESKLDDDYKLPLSKLDRLQADEAVESIKFILNNLFHNDRILTGDEFRGLPEEHRKEIQNSFKKIFEISINRPLFAGEKAILSRSITILLWQIQGKSFREILGLRHSYLSRRDVRRDLKKKLKSGDMSPEQYDATLRKTSIRYSPMPRPLPNSSAVSLVPSKFGTSVLDFNYDLLLYDTYDYLDKVISFSLSDVFSAAFGKYYEKSNDSRSKSMVNYFRFGTDDEKEIWLLRYGFAAEDIQKIKKYVRAIDHEEINFTSSVRKIDDIFLKERVIRYL